MRTIHQRPHCGIPDNSGDHPGQPGHPFTMHLILPFSACQAWSEHLPSTQMLPHLGRLLTQMQWESSLADEAPDQPHPLLPHERVLAHAMGWANEGPWPQTAHDTGLPGPQAWLTPCHWQVGMDRVVMLPPELLQLRDDESQQLLQAMRPWLEEDGLQVEWHGALRWHARGDLLANVRTASLTRVSGANIRPWITDGSLPPPLRRLQSEMQMLLYNHPVNDARMARDQLTVNAFWVHGAGAPAAARNQGPVQTLHDLMAAATQGASAWLQAWQRVDAQVIAPLAQTHTPLRLSLCSETTAHTWVRAPGTWHQRLRRLWRPLRTDGVLRALLTDSEET